MNGSEGLGNLFSYIVQLKTPDTLNLGYVSLAANLPLQPMVGKDLCVSIELDGGGKRYISGLVTAARVVGHEGRSVTYELRIEPWLKLLTHTSDYKAFQNKTVVDILDEVLDEYSFPVEKRLVENYPPRAWQVQYGETKAGLRRKMIKTAMDRNYLASVLAGRAFVILPCSEGRYVDALRLKGQYS